MVTCGLKWRKSILLPLFLFIPLHRSLHQKNHVDACDQLLIASYLTSIQFQNSQHHKWNTEVITIQELHIMKNLRGGDINCYIVYEAEVRYNQMSPVMFEFE